MGDDGSWARMAPVVLASLCALAFVAPMLPGRRAPPAEFVVSVSSPEPSWRISSVDTLVGSKSEAGFVDGCGSDAKLRSPRGLIQGDDGSFLFADSGNHAIRRLTLVAMPVRGSATGAYAACVETIAGGSRHGLVSNTSVPGFSGHFDGLAEEALFSNPTALTLIANPTHTHFSSYLVADTGNNVIRRLDEATGQTPARVETVVGNATRAESRVLDGVGPHAQLEVPSGIVALNDFGVFVITDAGAHVVRDVDLNSYRAHTALGRSGVDGFADGAHASARFDTPTMLRIASSRTSERNGDTIDLVLVDTGNNAIRRLVYDGQTWESATILGRGADDGFRDGDPTAAAFSSPADVAFPRGRSKPTTFTTTTSTSIASFAIADAGNNLVRYYDADRGTVSTLAGTQRVWGAGISSGEQPTPRGRDRPLRDAVDVSADDLPADDEAASRLSRGFLDAKDDPTQARFSNPSSILFTSDGHLIIADTDNHAIRIAYFAAAAAAADEAA
ncbi:hypothetical protein CTAYLR_003617 [Chrysophaeum taylorii]|uniref:NHL repeat containing protein n=1 Tax=Chrysophaeum taylorii TaxID=2483200 RepID=A0AAD7UDZ1_9STRA|nr:hypothetical protein CTAYLR_003617 [Chrysophaeum taylorii]